MKAYFAIFSVAAVFGVIWALCKVVPVINLLILSDVVDIVLPALLFCSLVTPFWKRLRGNFCDRYDRFLASMFFFVASAEVQMCLRLYNRIHGPDIWSDEALVWSLILMAIACVFQFFSLDEEKNLPAWRTWAKVGLGVAVSCILAIFLVGFVKT